MDEDPLDLDFGIGRDIGFIPGFEDMPDLVDSDDEEDLDDDFRDNEIEISELDLPQDDEITTRAVFDRVETPRQAPSPTMPQASSPTLPQAPSPTLPQADINMTSPTTPTNQSRFSIGRENIEKQLREPVIVQSFKDHFPDSKAGVPKSGPARPTSFTSYGSKVQSSDNNPYAPFSNRIDWEIAKWAKLRGPSSTAFSELLNIDGVQKALGLSYKNSRELNKIIDDDLPGTLPKFRCKTTPVLGEPVDLYYRPIMECVQALLGNVEFSKFLIYSPERHYSDGNCTIRLYHDMHTGKWWWDTQVCSQFKIHIDIIFNL